VPAALKEKGKVRDILHQNGQACTCTCSEDTFEDKNGETVPTGLHVHNCDYVARRNSLIPAAEAFANARVPPDERVKQTWARLFSRQMAKLMAEPQNGSGGR
jgi:hypothetical protein